MGLHVGIDPARADQDLLGEALERVVHAFWRLAGRGEEFDAGTVGLLFLART